MALSVGTARPADAAELARVAAATFPLACPPSVRSDDIAAFITEHLSAHRFTGYLQDPRRRVLAARIGGRMAGYAMLVEGLGTDPNVAAAVSGRPAIELSKMYVLTEHHGTGAAGALMNAAVNLAATTSAACVWLGVNQNNARAQRFYRKHGFVAVGERRFAVGRGVEDDLILARRLTDWSPAG